LRYEILGRPRVTHGDKEASLRTEKTERLLAALLIRADQVIPATQLVAEVWGNDPPPQASAGLHVHVSQLRKFLSRFGSEPIITRSPGYFLVLGPDELDAHLFQDAVRRGQRQLRSGSIAEAIDEFDAALALWRGPALGGLSGGPLVNGFLVSMEEARLGCIEMWAKANLILGEHRKVVALLSSLAAQHPLREAFQQFLMIALYRSGRQADALAVYQAARRAVIGELGVGPCRALRDTHQAILSGDGTLGATFAGQR
jgi:SARP family transcriptional regulator, regulator of embCAB operon